MNPLRLSPSWGMKLQKSLSRHCEVNEVDSVSKDSQWMVSPTFPPFYLPSFPASILPLSYISYPWVFKADPRYVAQASLDLLPSASQMLEDRSTLSSLAELSISKYRSPRYIGRCTSRSPKLLLCWPADYCFITNCCATVFIVYIYEIFTYRCFKST